MSRLVSEGQDACRSEWPVLLFNIMTTSGSELQLSGSVGLLQLGSVLIVDVPVIIEGCAGTEVKGPVGVSRPYCCWVSGDIQTKLLPRTMLGFMVLPRLASVLKSGPTLPPKVTWRPRVGTAT